MPQSQEILPGRGWWSAAGSCHCESCRVPTVPPQGGRTLCGVSCGPSAPPGAPTQPWLLLPARPCSVPTRVTGSGRCAGQDPSLVTPVQSQARDSSPQLTAGGIKEPAGAGELWRAPEEPLVQELHLWACVGGCQPCQSLPCPSEPLPDGDTPGQPCRKSLGMCWCPSCSLPAPALSPCQLHFSIILI